jgi:hypothetical protein
MSHDNRITDLALIPGHVSGGAEAIVGAIAVLMVIAAIIAGRSK